MSEVNVTELRQNLPDYLAEVRKGKELKVTVHGKVIARIVPEQDARNPTKSLWCLALRRLLEAPLRTHISPSSDLRRS